MYIHVYTMHHCTPRYLSEIQNMELYHTSVRKEVASSTGELAVWHVFICRCRGQRDDMG
jgi:hypothetical protein